MSCVQSVVPPLDIKLSFCKHHLAYCRGHFGTGMSIIRYMSALQYYCVVGNVRNMCHMKYKILYMVEIQIHANVV